LEIAYSAGTDQLLDSSLQGDERSFKVLYHQYARAMYNTALRILNNTADAEDILQESFMEAYKNLGAFARKATFGAWLRQIVIHKSINQLRKKRLILVDPDPEHDLAQEDMHTDDFEAEALKIEAIRTAMARLAPGFRAVLSLYLFEGYDHEEIAGILDMAPVTVRTQYLRGRKKLLQLIKEGGGS
jgi:RNA polymerase sigma factor (sigma-70 family)